MLITISLIVFLCELLNGQTPPTPCDPLVPQICYLPFPNDYWLIKDESGHGLNLNFSGEGLPIDVFGKQINPNEWNERLDGFSPIDAAMVIFEDLLLTDNIASLSNIGLSLQESHPIILLDAEYGDRIPIWAELDVSTPILDFNTLKIWPAVRLENSKTYIIAIRDLININNELIIPSPAFKALRDNELTDDESIEFRRDRYETFIFPTLESNGINRNTLQLAWEFTIMSDDIITKLLLRMRDDAFSRINNKNVEYDITNVIDEPFPNIARKIIGTMKVPYYINSSVPGVNVRIKRDENDILQPIFQSMEDVEFEILIPRNLAKYIQQSYRSNKHKKYIQRSRWLQYGHGTFQSYTQIEEGYLRYYANKYGYILGSTNWLGISNDNVPSIVQLFLQDLSDFTMITDRQQQGILNCLFLMKLMLSSSFIDDPAFKFDSKSVIIKPINRNFYGNSFGGLSGGVYMSLTDDVEHGVIGVAGIPGSMLLGRSSVFIQLSGILRSRYRNDPDALFILSLIQLIFNSALSEGYLTHIRHDLFPNTPSHQLLLHYCLGDSQVFYAASQTLGRSLECIMYESQTPEGPDINENIFGFDFIDDDIVINLRQRDECLIQGWYYNPPQPVPKTNIPIDPRLDTHLFTREREDAQFANYKFFSDKVILNPCNGECNVPFPVLSDESGDFEFLNNEIPSLICSNYTVFDDFWSYIIIYFCPDIEYNTCGSMENNFKDLIILEDNHKIIFTNKYGIGLKINNIGQQFITYCIKQNGVGNPIFVGSAKYCVDKKKQNCGQNFIEVPNICSAIQGN